MKELLIGCGSLKNKRLLWTEKGESPEWEGELITLDNNKTHSPDVIWDLNWRPLPFKDDEFDRIHAYEVLEHIGKQGEVELFFEEFYEYWRILKPDGELRGTCPLWTSQWAWGDPSHTRVITPGTFTFLSQKAYKDVGKNVMSDFRHLWKGDFEAAWVAADQESLCFILKAIKKGGE